MMMMNPTTVKKPDIHTDIASTKVFFNGQPDEIGNSNHILDCDTIGDTAK